MRYQFYALYKQSTVGQNTTPKPSFWDVVGKAKWDQWAQLGALSQEEAMAQYIDLTVRCIRQLPNINHNSLLRELDAELTDSIADLRTDTELTIPSPSQPPPRVLPSAESMATVGLLLDHEAEIPFDAESSNDELERLSSRLYRLEETVARQSGRRPSTVWSAWNKLVDTFSALSTSTLWQSIIYLMAFLWFRQQSWLWRWLYKSHR